MLTDGAFMARPLRWMSLPGGRGFAATITQPVNKLMTAEYLIDQTVMLAYRWAGYALLNWADDAAILALMFC